MSQEITVASKTFAIMGVEPKTLDQAKEICKLISDSDFVPKEFKDKPGNIMIAGQMGHELGLPLLQALQSIAVINGKPSIYGDAMLGCVRARQDLCDYVNESFEGEGKSLTAVCVAKRKDQEKPVISRFGMADAEKAGLAGKQGPWSLYPKRMLMFRARGFALRDAFPDVLKGIITIEEASDIPDGVVADTTAKPVLGTEGRRKVQLHKAPAAQVEDAEIVQPEPPQAAPPALSAPAAPPAADEKVFLSNADRRLLWGKARDYGYDEEGVRAYLKELGFDSTTKIEARDLQDILRGLSEGPAKKTAPEQASLPAPITPEQMGKINDALLEADLSRPTFKDYLGSIGIGSVVGITQDRLPEIMAWIGKKPTA